MTRVVAIDAKVACFSDVIVVVDWKPFKLITFALLIAGTYRSVTDVSVRVVETASR